MSDRNAALIERGVEALRNLQGLGGKLAAVSFIADWIHDARNALREKALDGEALPDHRIEEMLAHYRLAPYGQDVVSALVELRGNRLAMARSVLVKPLVWREFMDGFWLRAETAVGVYEVRNDNKVEEAKARIDVTYREAVLSCLIAPMPGQQGATVHKESSVG